MASMPTCKSKPARKQPRPLAATKPTSQSVPDMAMLASFYSEDTDEPQSDRSNLVNSSSKPEPQKLRLEGHVAQSVPMQVAGQPLMMVPSNPSMMGGSGAPPTIALCPGMCVPQGYVCMAVPTSMLAQMHQA